MSEFIISGFSDEINADFKTQLEEIKALGIAYIEIRGVNGRNVTSHTLEEITDIKKQMDLAGIGVSAIGSPIGKIKITDSFDSHFESFKHTVKIAEILEAKYIRLFSFFIDEGSAEIHRDEVMRRMTLLVDHVKGRDIILLHENEKDIYGDTAERCLDLYKTMNSPHFNLIFDPANFVQCGVVTYPHAFEMLKDYVIYYHIKDAIAETGEVVPSGNGDGQLREIMAELDQRNYKGFLSLEPHLGDFVGFTELEGENEIKGFTVNSDSEKFKLAYTSLMGILSDITKNEIADNISKQ